MLYEDNISILSRFTDSFKDFLTQNSIEIKELFTKPEVQESIQSSILPFISECLTKIDTTSAYTENDPEIVEFKKVFKIAWGQSLNLLNIHTDLLNELASTTQKIPADEVHIKEYILTRLLGRAIRTYQEIKLLLSQGYPYGALSLTRNLYELATITEFLLQHGKEVALAYYRASDKSIEQDDHYNWARVSGKFKETENITLKKIHELAGFEDDSYNELYKTLCNFVHISPQVTSCEIGSDSHDVVMGPTIFGIEAAGIEASRLVNRVALSVIPHRANSETLLKLIFIIEFGEYIRIEMSNVAKRLNNL